MKKFILGLGSVVAATAPIAAVVACGDEGTGVPGVTLSGSTLTVELSAKVRIADVNALASDEKYKINNVVTSIIGRLDSSTKDKIEKIKIVLTRELDNKKYSVTVTVDPSVYDRRSSGDSIFWFGVLQKSEPNSLKAV